MAEESKKPKERKRQFNNLQLSGHLGADPEYSKEKGFIRFPLPVENNPGEDTGWIQVVMFNDKAHEAASKNLKKASYIQITKGRLKVVPWESGGKKGQNVQVVAYEVKYFEDGKGGS